MTARPSLKSLAAPAAPIEPQSRSAPPSVMPSSTRQAQTRQGSRQVSGHYKAEVAHALRLLAAEQDKEQQEMLAEALNMLFERYGKSTRAEVLGTRRRKRDL